MVCISHPNFLGW